jgi:hypothetical protein
MFKKVFQFFSTLSNAILKLIRKWWRPVTCIAMAGSVYVHGVYLPMKTLEPADLVGLTGLITAVVAVFAVREWGKVRGVVDPE